MKVQPQRIIVAVLGVSAIALGGWYWLATREHAGAALSGYIEGEALYLAAPVSGTVTAVSVRRGDQVNAGQALFTIDPTQTSAANAGARAELAAAQAQAEDARKGQRPVELAVFDAAITAAQARLTDARADLARVEPLARQGFYPRARLDDARAAVRTAEADHAAAVSRRQAAALGARDDAVRAADARVAQATAGVTAAEGRLRDLSPAAPAAARVEEVFYQPGEWVTANQPVVSLLPAARVKLRFFVPEREIARYRAGREVAFACDGCASDLRARIAYVSPRPEFTPPVIYSRGARDRLVFLVEAWPTRPHGLVPGLPIDVTPLTAEAARS